MGRKFIRAENSNIYKYVVPLLIVSSAVKRYFDGELKKLFTNISYTKSIIKHPVGVTSHFVISASRSGSQRYFDFALEIISDTFGGLDSG